MIGWLIMIRIEPARWCAIIVLFMIVVCMGWYNFQVLLQRAKLEIFRFQGLLQQRHSVYFQIELRKMTRRKFKIKLSKDKRRAKQIQTGTLSSSTAKVALQMANISSISKEVLLLLASQSGPRSTNIIATFNLLLLVSLMVLRII